MNLSIKNVSDELVERLRLRARRNHRSLQGEMLAILEDAVGDQEKSAVTGQEYAAFGQAAETGLGLNEVRQTFVGQVAMAASLADTERARARDLATERAIELMQRGLSLGGRR